MHHIKIPAHCKLREEAAETLQQVSRREGTLRLGILHPRKLDLVLSVQEALLRISEGKLSG